MPSGRGSRLPLLLLALGALSFGIPNCQGLLFLPTSWFGSSTSTSTSGSGNGNYTTKVRIFFNDTATHLLQLQGVEVLDASGHPITDRALQTSMSSVLEVAEGEEGAGYHGPATLLPSFFDPAGDASIYDYPSTRISVRPWMELEFSADKVVGTVHLLNLRHCCQYQLIGAWVSVTSPNGTALLEAPITMGQPDYVFSLVREPETSQTTDLSSSPSVMGPGVVQHYRNTFHVGASVRASSSANTSTAANATSAGVDVIREAKGSGEQGQGAGSGSSGSASSGGSTILIASVGSLMVGGVAVAAYVGRGRIRQLWSEYGSTEEEDYAEDGEEYEDADILEEGRAGGVGTPSRASAEEEGDVTLAKSADALLSGSHRRWDREATTGAEEEEPDNPFTVPLPNPHGNESPTRGKAQSYVHK